MTSFSLSISHRPGNPDRRAHLETMLRDLSPLGARPLFIHDKDYVGREWEEVKEEWALTCWRWHCDQKTTHCVMMSDDLELVPSFWSVLEAMVEVAPCESMGLMSNHPMGPELWRGGYRWYRTQSWLVGPCIVWPRGYLIEFVRWYERWLPTLPLGMRYGHRGFFHDDSSMNEWISRTGRTSLHPLPAPIEHNLSIGRSHDQNPFPPHAAEWMSWRRIWHGNPSRDEWTSIDGLAPKMATEEYWSHNGGPHEAPLLMVEGV